MSFVFVASHTYTEHGVYYYSSNVQLYTFLPLTDGFIQLSTLVYSVIQLALHPLYMIRNP